MILENEIIQLRSYILEADNLVLKEQYLKWVQNYDNIEYINSISLLVNDDLDFLKNSFSRFTAKHSQGFFIYHKDSKKFVGTAKLDKIDFFRQSGEFGIMIGEQNFKRKNVGTFSMGLILDYSFKILGLHRVWGGCRKIISACRSYLKNLVSKRRAGKERVFILMVFAKIVFYMDF